MRVAFVVIEPADLARMKGGGILLGSHRKPLMASALRHDAEIGVTGKTRR